MHTIALLGSGHVGVDLNVDKLQQTLRVENDLRPYLGNRDIEIHVEAENGARKKNDEHRKRGILEVGHLDLHGSEFYPPSNGRVDGGRFKADSLPIS